MKVMFGFFRGILVTINVLSSKIWSGYSCQPFLMDYAVFFKVKGRLLRQHDNWIIYIDVDIVSHSFDNELMLMYNRPYAILEEESICFRE